MIHILAKRIIPNYKNTSDPIVRSQYGCLIGAFDFVVCLIMATVKLFIGFTTHSIALTSSGFSNLTESVTSIVTIVGFKVSVRKNDDSHPFGYARAEYITGLIVSFFILYIGIELSIHSISKIFHSNESSEFNWIFFVVMIFDVLINHHLFMSNKEISKLIDSIPLKISATKAYYAMIMSTTILGSMLLIHYLNINIDAIIGLVIAILIIYSGFRSAKDAINPLLGYIPDPQYTQEIKDRILAYPGVEGVHDMIIHTYGKDRCFISAHIEVPDNITKENMCQLACDIEQDFRFEGIYSLIHIDLIKKDSEEMIALKKELQLYAQEQDNKIVISDFQSMYMGDQIYIFFTLYCPYSYINVVPNIKELFSDFVKSQNQKYCAAITIKELFT